MRLYYFYGLLMDLLHKSVCVFFHLLKLGLLIVQLALHLSHGFSSLDQFIDTCLVTDLLVVKLSSLLV